MTQVLPGGNNTFVPSHEASGKLIVDFSRNPKDFAVNNYVQLIKAPDRVGYWLELNIDEAGRVLNDEGLEYLWQDGEDAPSGRDGTREHEYHSFIARRRAYPFLLGDLGVKQASWDIVAAHASAMAQKAMTVRTMEAVKVATTVANYDATHVLDITGGGVPGNTGSWAASTTARTSIKRSLNQAKEVILDTTLAGYDEDDLKLVISSQLANLISTSQEIVDYLKSSPFALAQVKGELSGQNKNSKYGLPSHLYGVEICVEKTRRRTNKRRAAAVTQQVLPTGTPFMVARPGGLEGHYGAPSFSALTNFCFEEMTTETKKDKDNRRTAGRIVEDYIHKMTASQGAVLFQNAV